MSAADLVVAAVVAVVVTTVLALSPGIDVRLRDLTRPCLCVAARR